MTRNQFRILRLKARLAEAENNERIARGALKATDQILQITQRQRDAARLLARCWQIVCAVALSGWLLTLAWGLCR